MWNVVVCDDNRHLTEEVKKFLLGLDGNYRIHTYTNEDNFIGDIEDNLISPDIVFMDIKLNHSNGIIIAKRLSELCPFCQIVFISGYDNYYLDVYEIEHIYFIKKPLKATAIKKALARAVSKLEKEQQEIFHFTNRGKTTVIPMPQILYFEKDRRKVLIHTVNGQCYDYYDRMEDLLNALTDAFIRCHNSYVVNLSKVTEMQHDKFILRDGREVPISRFYHNEVKQTFMEYIAQIAI